MSMKKNLIYLLLILMPFIDLITSLNERFNFLFISPNIIFKSFISALILVYIIFITKNKYKKKSLLYLIFLGLFILTYLVVHLDINNINFLWLELNNIFKYMFYPLIIIGFINASEDKLVEFSKLTKILIIVYTLYLGMLFIPNLLNIGFRTYELSYLKGQVGWFYAANEISALLIILYPLVIYLLIKKKYLAYYIILLISCYSLNSIGTKTALLGLLLGVCLTLIYYVLKEFKSNKKCLFHFTTSIIIVLVFSLNSLAIYNHNQNIYHLEHPKNEEVENLDHLDSTNKVEFNIKNSFIIALFSNRLDYFENTLNIYINKPTIEKIIGIGFSDSLEKYIEIDFLDYFFHYGIIGFMIMLIPTIGIIIIYLKKKDYQLVTNTPFLIAISLGLFTSLIAGHIFNAPSVATIYGVLIIALILPKEKDNYYATLLDNVYKEGLDNLHKELQTNLKKHKKTFIITANPETFVLSKTNKTLNQILNDTSNIIVPDGIAIIKACNLYGYNIKERITGIDLVSFLLKELNQEKKSLYLFGAKKEIIESFVNKIRKQYPNIKILGYKDGYIKDKTKVFQEISQLNPDICLVAMGIPMQEELIYKNLKLFKKGIFIGVGGSFDVLSGNKKRAPKIFQKLNLEWLYRLLKEPKRLKRFIKYNLNYIIEIYLEH